MDSQLNLLKFEKSDYVSLKEASAWASHYLNKTVTKSQISYLINYGRIESIKANGKSYVCLNQLQQYYDNRNEKEHHKLCSDLSDDVNLSLSFSEYNESERTKHVHRLHPYKGKFIPQLVEYFLDEHTDSFKTDSYFKPNDIVLDPFAGSGTTLVQANELGIHAIGIELSVYNSIITKIKIEKYDLAQIKTEGNIILSRLQQLKNDNSQFNDELNRLITDYNNRYFPSPDYRKKVYAKEINEKEYGYSILKEFNVDYNHLLTKYNKSHPNILYEKKIKHNFLERWFNTVIQKEIKVVKNIIEAIKDEKMKNLFMIILGRAVRSCRATKHVDLATLKEPQFTPYYCERKHFKICKPVESLSKHIKRYFADTIRRIEAFNLVKTDALNCLIEGDSSNIQLDEIAEIETLFNQVGKSKIDGIFTSPPYVGQIDYHDQHQYAYEIFNFPMKKDQEIGILGLGKSKKARKLYTNGIINVLRNVKPYLKGSANCFIVANDKFELYPNIIKESKYELINEFKRPVLNRAERSRQVYEESIFYIMPKG